MPPIPFHRLPSGPRWKRRGIALILVLACVVLLTVMVLAFLASVGTEVQSSKFYANGSSVKLLGQSATDLVMAEIRDATANGALCWASQPGMIRTFDNTGAAKSYYKLYSDAGMVGTGVFDNTQTLVPSNWYSQKGVYIDLNQPITAANGVNQYPILDGDADANDLTSPSGSIPASAGIPSGTLVMGPNLTSGPYVNCPQVAGFWINGAAALTAPNPVSPATPTDPSSANNAPMPVRWLYVLKDGKIAVPNTVTSNVVSFYSADPVTGNSLPVPSASDPIVGRMAFWTDDETSKVNINTAGESQTTTTVTATGGSATTATGGPLRSTVWDVPRADSSTEVDLSRYQPAQNEFQRYPGHPATVSLSAVFGSLTTDSKFPENIFNSSATTPSTPATGFAGVAPRLTGSAKGAQQNGLFGGEIYGIQGAVGSWEGTQVSSGALPLAASRLYANPDEMLFQPTRSSLTNANLSNTAGSAAALAELDPAMLRRTGFFLTAKSRAPDVNVFNQPRVSIWPVSSTSANWTANDQLIAFCTTINQQPYYFQRGSPNDQIADLPNTPVAAANTGVNRNRNVMEYLRNLASQNIPGFGGNFGGAGGKYVATDTTGGGVTGSECDQILTEIFDYIRCTNIQDTMLNTADAFAIAIPTGIGSAPYTPGLGQVVPIVDTFNSHNTRGLGRFPTIASASLVFFPLQNAPAVWFKDTLNQYGSGFNAIIQKPFATQMQAVLVLQMFDPSQAFPPNIPWYQIQVSGLSSLKWGGLAEGAKTMFNSDTATIGNPYGGNYTSGQNVDRQIGGMIDFRRLLVSSYTGYNAYNPGGTSSNAYNFGTTANSGNLFSSVYPSSPATSTPYTSSTNFAATGIAAQASVMGGFSAFSYTGGVVTFKIYSNTATGTQNQLLQTISFTFPGDNAGTLPPIPSMPGGIHGTDVPQPIVTHVPLNTSFNTTATDGNNAGWQLWYNRMQDLPDMTTTGGTPPVSAHLYSVSLICDGDVIRSAIPMNGDFRLLAARQTIPQSVGDGYFFKKHPAFGSGVNFAHDLQDGLGRNVEWGGPCYGSGVVYGNANTVRGGAGGALVSINSSDTPHLTQAYGGLNPTYALGVTWYPDYFGYADTTGYDGTTFGDIPSQRGAFVGDATASMTSSSSGAVVGDWDNGIGNLKDGPYINKADEGSNYHSFAVAGGYFDPTSYANPGAAFFSPNRMIPSAGMFGSLPTGVLENKPWQTLLFRAGPLGHPGLGTQVTPPSSTALVGPPYTTPPDHLFMDLFTMPVIEPYAISEPLSTAGRINMNYQIVPFTYINRSTAVQAALRSVLMMSIPNTDGTAYKQPLNPGPWPSPSASGYRFGLNMSATLSQFYARFNNKDIFRAPSEICSIDLVPSNCTTPADSPGTLKWRQDMDAYWAQNALTGDNTRERPYANLYPLLTTKSNTFTIHYRVQSLKAPAGSDMTTWTETPHSITGEYRGSQTVERYVDANDSSIPDFTLPANYTATLAPYYAFRVVSTKQFAP